MTIKPPAELESIIQTRIINYLKTVPGLHYFKVAQGPYSRGGVSDIICCYGGQLLAIEVKRPGGKPTPLQQQFQNNIRAAGGVAIVASTLDEVRVTIAGMSGTAYGRHE